jgi:hypothetical protein
MKPKYDETFESGHHIHRLGFDTSIMYQKHKKILVVSPRDLTMLIKLHRVSPNEVFIMAKSVTIDSHPPNKNIVRAENYCGGWRLKQIRPKCTKAFFYSEVDFKISLFI